MPTSFANRITAYFGALFLAATGLLFCLWYFGFAPLGITGSSQQRLTEAMHLLEVKANLQHVLIARGIEERRGDISILANREAFSRQLAQDPPQVQPVLTRAFAQFQNAYPNRYRRLLIVDPQSHQIVASSAPDELGHIFQNTALLARAMRTGAHELVEQGEAQATTPALLIVHSIRTLGNRGLPNGKLVGLLIAHVELEQLVSDGVVPQPSDGQEAEHTALLDATGRVLARYPAAQTVQATFQPSRQTVPAQDSTLVQTDPTGQTYIAVYRHLPLSSTQGWTVVHFSSVKEALGSLQESANALLGVGLVLTLLALACIGVAARHLTRPLHGLADTARKLGAGDLFARYFARGGESQEISTLSQAFNTMAGDIQRSHQTLEALVQARTEALQLSQARHRTLFESSPDALLVLDHNAVIDCNPAAVKLFGVSGREGLVGLNPAELSPTLQPHGEDSRAAAHQWVLQSILHGSQVFEWLHLNLRSGQPFLAEVQLNRVEIEQRTLIQGTVRDISARKRAEEQLRLSEQSLAITLQSIGDAVIATDAQGLVTRMNTTAERLTGWSLADACGRPLSDVFHIVNSQTRALAVNPVQTVMERGDVVGLTNHTALLARDGRQYQISDSAAPIRDPEGNIVGVVLVFSDVSADYRMRQELARTSDLLQRTGEVARIGGWELDVASMQFVWSPMTFHIHDMEPGPTPTLAQSIDLFVPEARPTVQAAMQAALAHGTPYDLELQKMTAKGRTIWVRIQGFATMENAKVTKLFGAIHDITERRKAEADLRIAAIAFESQEGMYVTDAQWLILRVNQAFMDITGYSATEALGQRPRQLLDSGQHDAAFFAGLSQSVQDHGAWQGEVWNRRKTGEIFPVWLIVTAVKADDGTVTHHVATMTDITQRKVAEDQIKNLAFYDPLTQLPNRRLLLNRLEKAMVTGLRNGLLGALLFVDLDNFKTLNDTLGHDKGDLLLQQVALRLRTCVREGDTVARLGGDEFVIMLESLSEVAVDAATQAEVIGEKILTALNLAYHLGNYEHYSTPSIGVTLFGLRHESMEEPLKRADLAMYQSKAAGRNTLRFFDPKMQAIVTARVALEAGLREALVQDQFVLYYQGQVHASDHNTTQFTGAEVLVRWQHPQRGMVSPAEFIALAEETGLILPLGQWILETACRQLAAWATQPALAMLTVAVNVSAVQFQQPDFVDRVLAALHRTGANAQLLKLELTEGLLVSNVEDIIAKMGALKVHGVRFALDDFGTGYSSLSYLKRLPLSQLKIDQGFVRDILGDPNDAAIAKMVIVLAESLGLSVIAEGVETTAQRDFLAAQGCHSYQGYLFCRPLPVHEFENLVLQVTTPSR